MTKNKKAAGCGDTQAARQNIYELNSTHVILTLKAACFQAAAWLSVVGGALL
ncbi:MAG: hypothetical protein ACXWT1_13970 [Methylobacter sp.]